MDEQTQEQRINLGNGLKMAEQMERVITGSVTTEGATIRPMHDQVLVRPLDRESEEKLVGAGLLYAPATAKKEARGRCEVIAVGPGGLAKNGRTRLPMPVKPGDIVFIDFGAGALVQIGGVEHLVLPAHRIGAVEE